MSGTRRFPWQQRSRSRQTSSRTRWIAVAVSMLSLLCVAATVVAAVAARSSAQSRDQRAVAARTRDIAASMSEALRRETDFVASLRATVVSRAEMTNEQFGHWVTSSQGFARYPGGIGFGFVASVPAAQLRAFGAKVLRDPWPSSLAARRFSVVPGGSRPRYCLVRLSAPVPGARSAPSPLGLDVCATSYPGVTSASVGSQLSAVADSGGFSTQALDKTHGIFSVSAPVYRDGRVPTTVRARRAALLGWVSGTYSGAAILQAAGAAQERTRVQLILHDGGGATSVVAGAGTAGAGAPSNEVPIAADGVWSVRITGAGPDRGVSADGQFWMVLLAGLGASALIAGLLYVLARGRGHALKMVQRKTDELQYQALHDSLTGLPNRALILDRVEQALARTRRQGSAVAVMFLDLDGFKSVNDTFGHAAGDQLLQAVGRRLTTTLRGNDTVGRLGGDEFVVLVEGDSLDAGPEVIADRIRQVLDEPYRLGPHDDRPLHATCSVGIAVGARASADELLRDADVALYRAKEDGKARFVVFAPEMQTAIQQRRELETDLRLAIDADQLSLVYQPSFNLSTQAITGVEALVRWHHPTRGLIMPDAFIPLAEETSLIVDIGRRVLREACRQAAEWQAQGLMLPVSVNVSGRQLDRDVDFVDDVERALEASGLQPALLMLEFPETMLMRDGDASARRLHALKALGVRIAIDDFGSGYSSLGYLQQFPVDALKIDRAFINSLRTSSESGALIHTLVQLGKALSIETLAEGIEDPQQLKQLQREGCDSGQGFLFARPLSPDALRELIMPSVAGSTPG